MAADKPYGEFYDFYSVNPEYFGYTLVHRLKPTVRASSHHSICFSYFRNGAITNAELEEF
jgi:hypothetical protein